MSIKISFIVPVYNVEKYLTQCIESILNQNYNDIEIILVDDGSSDSSPNICDKFANNDNRIKVVHKKNGGQSSARNIGVKLSTGDYICFVDSDDFWIDNRLKNIVDQIFRTKCDLLIFPALSYYTEKKQFEPFSINDINTKYELFDCKTSLLKLLKIDYTFGWVPWRYIIRKDIVNGKIGFLEGYLCEDVNYVFDLWNNAKYVSFFKEDVYAYRRDNNNSTTHIASFKFSKDLLYMIEINLSKFKDYCIDGELKNRVYINFQNLIFVVLFWYSIYTNEQKKEIVKKVKEMKYIFNVDREYKTIVPLKNKLIKLLINTFGVRFTGMLWGVKRRCLKTQN